MQTEVLTEANSAGTIKASCRVIPALELGSGECCFSDTNTLSFAAADPANYNVSHPGINRMRQTEDRHHHVTVDAVELLAGEAGWDVTGATGSARKGQSLSNGEMGEVVVKLGIVKNIATEGGTNTARFNS